MGFTKVVFYDRISTMLTKRQKQNAMKDTARHEKDTGSSEVQISLLSKRIKLLADHLKKNPKDFTSRRGLLMMVGKRRKLLQYLKENDEKSYSKIAKKLEIEA
jgi:small subunit ribosomal protein S15